MAKDAVATMGSILPDDAGGRDAVHVAVVSAVSDNALRPGQDIGIEIVEGQRDVRAHPVSSTREGVGKVDPYLTANVKPGQRFWLYLYPRSITGLNHNWSHPAFPDAKPGEVYANPANKLASEKWIRDYAERSDCPDLDTLVRLVNGEDVTTPDDDYGHYGWRLDGDYLLSVGSDAHGEIDPALWGHLEIVTGKKITQRPEYFSCSC